MTITNRELFYRDPTETKIPNDGVAKVMRPATEQQWDVLRWELRSFVCDGQYARGLEVPDDALAWAAETALELRRRVKEQQALIGAAEFGKVDLSYRVADRPEKVVYCEESVQHRLRAGSGPAPATTGRRDSEVLPEPDPAEVRSSVGSKAKGYAVGDVIDGRFEILDVLGQGGFSTVYRVRDDVEAEERALKLFDNAAGYEAVRREIGALRKIHHPNVVRVFWAGKTTTGDWYLITEYIDGESLDEYATGKRNLRDREAIDVARDILDALAAIHPDAARIEELDRKKHESELSEAEYGEWMELQDKGLVHRDIKPLNVMLTRTGVKLLDFNIASRVGDPVYTQSGTPPYQAPDADLTRWDVSTDLFAVGVMLYELLCNGQHPYPGSKPTVGESVIDPRTIRPDLDSALAELLGKACAPHRSERFATAEEMKDALSALRNGGR
jgi:tRNA A-37 threonylcarbamoyl transferase component Bud32